MWHRSGGEGEMPFWSSNPLFLWFSTPLLPIFVTEADNGGGPDGVCYTCFAVVRLLFIRHRGSSSSSRPPRRRFFFFFFSQSLKRREEARNERETKTNAPIRLSPQPHVEEVSPPRLGVCVCVLWWRGCVPPAASNSSLISQYHWY